jgi:hypothetical protein
MFAVGASMSCIGVEQEAKACQSSPRNQDGEHPPDTPRPMLVAVRHHGAGLAR